MLTHRNIVFDAEATRIIVDVGHRDRLLSILTLAHTYECTLGLVTIISCGASVHLPGPAAFGQRPAPRARRGPAHHHALGPAGHREDLPLGKSCPSWRRASSTGSPAFGGSSSCWRAEAAPDLRRPDPDLRHRRRRPRPRRGALPRGSACSRTPSATASPRPRPSWRALPRSRPGRARPGRCSPGIEVRIADARPGTREGEIQVKGPNVMQGYYRESRGAPRRRSPRTAGCARATWGSWTRTGTSTSAAGRRP